MEAVVKEPPRCTLSVSDAMLITNRGFGWVLLLFLSPTFLSYYESNSTFNQIRIGFSKSYTQEACLNALK